MRISRLALLALCGMVITSVLGIYKLALGPVSIAPAKLFSLAAYGLLLLSIDYRASKLTRRQLLLVILLLLIAVVLLIDLLRSGRQPRYVINTMNHIYALSYVVLIVMLCRSEKQLSLVLHSCMLGSILALAIGAYWLWQGQLPFPGQIANLAGSDVSLADISVEANGLPRLASSFYDPNFYGLFLVLVLAVLSNRICYQGRGRLPILLFVLNVIALLLTLSRTSLLGFLLLGAISLAFFPRTRRFWLRVFAAGVVVLIVLVGVRGGVEDFAVLARFTELADSAGRLPYHLAGRDAFLAQPLVGSSSEGLLHYLQQYRFTTNTSAHLVYLTWLAKYGLVGWTIYMAFLVAPLLLVGLDRRYDQRWRHLVVGAYLPLLFMYLAYDYFLTVEIQYIIFGIGYALALQRPETGWPATPQATT